MTQNQNGERTDDLRALLDDDSYLVELVQENPVGFLPSSLHPVAETAHGPLGQMPIRQVMDLLKRSNLSYEEIEAAVRQRYDPVQAESVINDYLSD